MVSESFWLILLQDGGQTRGWSYPYWATGMLLNASSSNKHMLRLTEKVSLRHWTRNSQMTLRSDIECTSHFLQWTIVTLHYTVRWLCLGRKSYFSNLTNLGIKHTCFSEFFMIRGWYCFGRLSLPKGMHFWLMRQQRGGLQAIRFSWRLPAQGLQMNCFWQGRLIMLVTRSPLKRMLHITQLETSARYSI